MSITICHASHSKYKEMARVQTQPSQTRSWSLWDLLTLFVYGVELLPMMDGVDLSRLQQVVRVLDEM
jgi:hypothetical protein